MKNIIKKGIQVKVLTGKDKNKSGEVIKVFSRKDKILIKGINFIKKHVKTTKEKKGGIFTKENVVHISNVKIIDKKKDEIKNNIKKNKLEK